MAPLASGSPVRTLTNPCHPPQPPSLTNHPPGEPFIAVPYAILLLLVIGVITLTRILITRRRRDKAAFERAAAMQVYPTGGPPLSQQQEGYYRPDVPSDAPPAYNQGIHLQQYPSSQSLPQVDQAPVQPRPMV